MLIGSGLLAKAFAPEFSKRDDVCIYAAGVSNSGCINPREFMRERRRLTDAMDHTPRDVTLVYFSTCSTADPEVSDTPYVLHKLAMEELVATHPLYLVIRLPQVAGKTPNPHTLLNYLYARISRSESFPLWSKAKRNIIDVVDAVTIVKQILSDASKRNLTLNVANLTNYSVIEIVQAMERIVGKKSLYEVVDRGAEYPIDIEPIRPLLAMAGIDFEGDYLGRIISKYYR